MPTRARLLTLIATAALFAAPTGAAHASGLDVLRDCNANAMKSHYPAADYAAALADIPADVAEYSPCVAQIKAARDRDLAATAHALGVAGSRVTSGLGGPRTGLGDPSTGSAEGATGATTPTPTTLPLRPARAASTDRAATIDAASALALLPEGADDDLDGGSRNGNGLPAIPIVLAFVVIALSGARALQWWGDRPEPEPTGAVPRP